MLSEILGDAAIERERGNAVNSDGSWQRLFNRFERQKRKDVLEYDKSWHHLFDRFEQRASSSDKQEADLGAPPIKTPLSREVIPGLPRQATFRRQNSEKREQLSPVDPLDACRDHYGRRILLPQPSSPPVSSKPKVTETVDSESRSSHISTTDSLPVLFGNRCMIQCTDCNKIFQHNWDLRKHQDEAHPLLPKTIYRSSVSSPNAIDTLAPPTSINIATTQHALSKDAGSKIYNHVIFPIALRKNLREFHPFVNSIPERIARGEIVCLRDLENTLLWLAPVFSRSKASFLDFCETSIQCIRNTLEYLDEHDQRRSGDRRPYNDQYFLDLVAHVRQRAASFKDSSNDSAKEDYKTTHHIDTRQINRLSKVKRGLPGFVNGKKKSALADTGAAQNVISDAYAKEMKLQVKDSPSLLRLGNRKGTRSLGTVNMRWAFAEKPAEIFDIICHVLPHCTYDLILGSGFLTATETMSKYRRRITECVFSIANAFHLNFLGNDSQYLRGSLADRYTVLALPDTGAEVNVIDKDYATKHGLKIRSGPKNRGLVEFADGTSEETLGQVTTSWTFESGKRINLTFEVLENLCSDVIIGEDVLWEHDVFNKHTSSMGSFPPQSYQCTLAPFTFLPTWLKKSSKDDSLTKTHTTPEALEFQERTRRALWHNEFGFGGANASEAEHVAENTRRRKYDAELQRIQEQRSSSQKANIPRIPSVPTSSSRRGKSAIK